MKRFVVINDSDLTQEILNVTKKYNTDFLRWNTNKELLDPKKYIIDICGDTHGNFPDQLITYYFYTPVEILVVLEASEWDPGS